MHACMHEHVHTHTHARTRTHDTFMYYLLCMRSLEGVKSCITNAEII